MLTSLLKVYYITWFLYDWMFLFTIQFNFFSLQTLTMDSRKRLSHYRTTKKKLKSELIHEEKKIKALEKLTKRKLVCYWDETLLLLLLSSIYTGFNKIYKTQIIKKAENAERSLSSCFCLVQNFNSIYLFYSKWKGFWSKSTMLAAFLFTQ